MDWLDMLDIIMRATDSTQVTHIVGTFILFCPKKEFPKICGLYRDTLFTSFNSFSLEVEKYGEKSITSSSKTGLSN